MFSSPALCHFRKTRTQCLSGRTENNHGTDSWFPSRHETQDVQNVVRSIMVRPLANHIIICATDLFLLLPLQACSHTTHLPPPPSYSKCTLLPSIPPPSFCSDSPQYHLQGRLSITTLLGASRRFFRKRRFWLPSAD